MYLSETLSANPSPILQSNCTLAILTLHLKWVSISIVFHMITGQLRSLQTGLRINSRTPMVILMTWSIKCHPHQKITHASSFDILNVMIFVPISTFSHII